MPNINYPIEKKLFKKLKKLADTHFSNNAFIFMALIGGPLLCILIILICPKEKVLP